MLFTCSIVVCLIRMQDDVVAVNKEAGMAVHGEQGCLLHVRG